MKEEITITRKEFEDVVRLIADDLEKDFYNKSMSQAKSNEDEFISKMQSYELSMTTLLAGALIEEKLFGNKEDE